MEIKKQGSLYVLVLEMGEEVIASLSDFSKNEGVASAWISAIGALRDFELGYYYLDRKQYGRKKFEEIAELITCSGNIAMRESQPFAHIHAVMGRDDYSVIGGHLFTGIVAVTAEIMLFPLPNRMERAYDERTGLYLLSSASGKTL